MYSPFLLFLQAPMAPLRWRPYIPEEKVQIKKVTYVSICRHSFCRSAVKKGSCWCPAHACREPSCGESEDCPQHVCRISYCRGLKRSSTSHFCKVHRCALCDKSRDCPQHVCRESHCTNLRVKGSIWCDAHKCPINGCMENRHCKTHICQITGFYGSFCNSLSVEGSHFCFDHKCGVEGCSSSTECNEHRCLLCIKPAVKGRYCRYDACLESTCLQSRQCPLHMCNGCFGHKKYENSNFCSYCKCKWCDDHKRCVLHKCISCNKVVYTDQKTRICAGCACDFCPNMSIYDKKCYIHAQRCMECDEIAVIRGVFCKKHGRCQLCHHKPRLPNQSTCGRHHRAVARFPQHYPPVVEKRRGLFDVIRAMLYDGSDKMAFHKLPIDVLTTIGDFVIP